MNVRSSDKTGTLKGDHVFNAAVKAKIIWQRATSLSNPLKREREEGWMEGRGIRREGERGERGREGGKERKGKGRGKERKEGRKREYFN